jgi:fermentation-respiration switch protein FrsA (DUF1100 family)
MGTHGRVVVEERPVVFNNRRGQRLFGVLHLPVREVQLPAVILVHGFTDDKTGDNRLFVKFARCAAETGIAVLRFDCAGSGDSEGDFSRVTLDSEIDDLRSAIDFVYNIPEIDNTRLNLVGYSLGGAVSIIVASQDVRVRSFIGWSPAGFLPKTFQRVLGKRAFFLAQQNEAVACANGDKQFYLERDFFSSLEKHRPDQAISTISPRPILLVQGTVDEKVLPRETESLFENAREHKQLHLIEGAGHSFAFYEEQLIDRTLQSLLQWNITNRSTVKGMNFAREGSDGR